MAQMYCNPASDSILEGMWEDVAEDVKNTQNQVHTHGTINNAIWETITSVASHVWDGQSAIFPKQIKAYHSAEFDHTGTKVASSAAVVYRFKNKATQWPDECDWILAWYNPSKLLPVPQQDRVYTDIRQPGDYTQDVWNKIYDQLQNSKNYATVIRNGYVATVTLNNDEFVATLTLGRADNVA